MTDQQLIAEFDEFRHQSAELATKIDAMCSQEHVPANVALAAFHLLTIYVVDHMYGEEAATEYDVRLNEVMEKIVNDGDNLEFSFANRHHTTCAYYGLKDFTKCDCLSVPKMQFINGDGTSVDMAEHYDPESGEVSYTVRQPAKVGRNESCPCGSGKKYKRCCGGAVN
jgi:hypothetical protein